MAGGWSRWARPWRIRAGLVGLRVRHGVDVVLGLGLDPRLAAALAVFGSLTGQLLAVFSVRRGFDWKLLWPFVAGGLAGVPLGVQLLPMLDMTWFKAVLGAILAIWCPTMLFAARLPRIKGSRVGDGAAGLVGGVMGGIGGFTGVVPTLWCTLCGFDKHAQRASSRTSICRCWR